MYGFFLDDTISRFSGIFGLIIQIATYYWLFAVPAGLFVIFRMPDWTNNKKKLIMDLLLLIGIILLVLFIASCFSIYTGVIRLINGLGGIEESERKEFYVVFKFFFVDRLSIFLSLMAIVIFERFSLLPYWEARQKEKIK